MKQKLPKVFANRIDKKINNNNIIYMSDNQKQEQEESINDKKNNLITYKKNQNKKTIDQKINEILKKREYVYKIPVKIKMKDREIITNIIGKNNTNIITLNNELIKINEIEDIEDKIIDKKNE